MIPISKSLNCPGWRRLLKDVQRVVSQIVTGVIETQALVESRNRVNLVLR